jgi:hypothetical protein
MEKTLCLLKRAGRFFLYIETIRQNREKRACPKIIKEIQKNS